MTRRYTFDAVVLSAAGDGSRPLETPRERRRRLMNEVFEEIRATRSGFSSSENVPRQTLYERRAVR